MSSKTKSYECVRCGFKADTSGKMKIHINRKIPCKISDTGIDVDLIKYKTQIIDHTFENMLRCKVCNTFFDDKNLFIDHEITCRKEISTEDTSKTLADYEKIKEERNNLEIEVRNLRISNRVLNMELFKFAGIVNSCIDDYTKLAE